MCGIFGVINKANTDKEYTEALKLMNHRGPDFTGVFSDDNVFLGHNRLSIIDLDERSNQPFIKDDWVIIFNGEIYNYLELIKQFNLQITTSSDTEVLLEMYKKMGAKCLEHLNGMFAFCIYQKSTQNYFIARDRLGIKPIYFRDVGDRLEFASEIAPLLALKQEQFYDFGIRQYLKLRMTVKGDTIYENIKMFPAGHYMENGKVIKYWDLHIEEKEAPKDEELDTLLRDAIKIRCRADVPLGTYLSGGLDSTIVTCLVKPSHSWTVGFEEMNEFDWGQMAADQLPGIHHEIKVDKEEYLKVAKWMVEKRKEPLSVPNEVLIYLMTKQVKTKNTVVLSGEGADELFFGYDRIFRWANQSSTFKMNEFEEKYCYGSHKDDEVLDFALENIPGKRAIDKVAYYFQRIHLEGLLRRVDNSTMLCSVEARVPFVDHRLVEMMAGTPFEWRMGNSFKEPLKRIYNNLLPQEIINRKKIGFPVPLSSIFESNQATKTAMDNWLDFNINTLKQIT